MELKKDFVYGLPALPEGASASWSSRASWSWRGNGSPAGDPRTQAWKKAELGDALLRQGRPGEALQAYQEAAQLQPHEVGYHLKVATVARDLEQRALTLHHLLQAEHVSPDSASIQDMLARWYHDEGDSDAAMRHSARARALAPDDPHIAVARAWILVDSGRLEEAWQLISPLIAAGMPSAHLGVLFGRMAPRLGRQAQALEFIDHLLASTAIQTQERGPLHHAAAALLDRAGEYDRAFEQLRLGKAVNRVPYDRQATTQWIDSQIRYFTPAKLHDLPRASRENRRPVFIIGMPRSGTSLVEQIVSSHPQVHGAGELPALARIMEGLPNTDWARGEQYPACLDAMGIRQANRLAATYLAGISTIDGDATYVTDKMPTNFALLGLIATLFPDSHVIHCTRHPLDTCLSCYMASFVSGQPYARDLTDLGTYYRDYHRFMVHWKMSLHYPVIEVSYEELVRDQEGQTRRLLELLDLPWDDRCLRYYEAKRRVATASRDQVRKPIYASSIGRWKSYEKHLAELIAALGSCLRK